MTGLLPHQQRVVAELEELTEKLTNLKRFLDTDFFGTLGPRDKDLLYEQSDIMDCYRRILEQRIARFA